MNSTTTTTATEKPTTLRVWSVCNTDEERRADMDRRFPNRPNCCFCKEKVECAYGNNPAPVGRRGKCCNECNQVVILVRMGIIPLETAKKQKGKYLKGLYTLVVGNPPAPAPSPAELERELMACEDFDAPI